MTGSRVCYDCGVEKPSAHFGKCRGVCRECVNRIYTMHKYGVDPVEMLAKQGGACLTCGAKVQLFQVRGGFPQDGPRMGAMDHDHRTGRIRGVLCASCNVALGHVKDSAVVLRALADHVERNGSPE